MPEKFENHSNEDQTQEDEKNEEEFSDKVQPDKTVDHSEKKTVESIGSGISDAKKELDILHLKDLCERAKKESEIMDTIYSLDNPEHDSKQEKEIDSENPQVESRRSFLKKMAIVTGIAIAGSTAYEAGLRGYKKFKSNKEGFEIKERTGIDIKDIAEKCGFEVHFEVDNGDGQYVLHIGQIHLSGEINKSEKTNKEIDIIETQKKIERLILEFKRLGIGEDVYIEGMSSTVAIDMLKDEKKRTDSLANSVENYNKLVKDLVDMDKGEMDAFFDINGLIIESHCCRLKIKEIEDFFEKHPLPPGSKEEANFNAAKKWLERFLRQASYLIKDKDSIYLAGGAQKLCLEGQINHRPAEDHDLNARATELAYIEGKFSVSRNSKVFEMITTEREKTAIKIISNDMKENQRFALLVFGAAHDFKKTITENNEQNPSRKIGLIKLDPEQ